MTPKEKIIKELDEHGNVLYNKFGTDSYLERCTIHDLKTKIKALTLTDVSQQSEVLPEFLTKDSYGKIVTAYIGGADVTKEWNEYLSNCR